MIKQFYVTHRCYPLGQSSSESNNNESVVNILKFFTTWALLSDSLVSYPEHLLGDAWPPL